MRGLTRAINTAKVRHNMENIIEDLNTVKIYKYGNRKLYTMGRYISQTDILNLIRKDIPFVVERRLKQLDEAGFETTDWTNPQLASVASSMLHSRSGKLTKKQLLELIKHLDSLTNADL